MLRAVILIAALVAVKGDECVRRTLKENFIVCVCNATYCDTISKPKLEKNQILRYTSTEDGKRMESEVTNFSAKNESEESHLVFTVDSNIKFQEIHGFGGAMTDAAALNIKTLSNETQQMLLEAYYGSTGIGYSFCRIPIAGTDFSTRPYTYDDTPGDITLSQFELVKEDDYKIHYLQTIKEMMSNPKDLNIFTTAWSAPAWMKTTNKITWGVLKREYYPLYAEYIKKFFDAYKERGIDIWGMTPGNEPINGFIPFFPFNAMGWTPINSANWVTNYLAPTLTNAGYNPVYMALDDQRFEIPSYIDQMFDIPRAKELFSGTAVHWYADQLFSPMRLSQLHDKYPDKFILMTEACTGSKFSDTKKVILGSWERGEEYILDIIENISHWATGWIDWNIALNETGGPNWARNFVDSPIIVMPENDEFYKQPMFYAIAHFSNFVPRGSYRISCMNPSMDLKNTTVKLIAFVTPENQIITVAVNENPTPIPITIKDKNSSKMVNFELPAKSFNTFLYMAQQ